MRGPFYSLVPTANANIVRLDRYDPVTESFTIGRVIDPDPIARPMASFYCKISQMRPLGPKTIQINAQQPGPSVLIPKFVPL